MTRPAEYATSEACYRPAVHVNPASEIAIGSHGRCHALRSLAASVQLPLRKCSWDAALVSAQSGPREASEWTWRVILVSRGVASFALEWSPGQTTCRLH